MQPVEVDDWWLTVGDPAPVPPLLLNSPTDLDKKQHWWPGSNKDIDHLKEDVLVNNKSWNVQIGTDNNSLPKSNPADFHGRKDIPSLFLDELLEDEVEVKQRKAAAVNIQRWFRGFRARKKLKGHSAIKQLLTEKKNEKEKQTMENHINLTDVCTAFVKKKYLIVVNLAIYFQLVCSEKRVVMMIIVLLLLFKQHLSLFIKIINYLFYAVHKWLINYFVLTH